MTHSWTQPLCATCWTGVEPLREPLVLKPEFREIEKCAMCGTFTGSGIYRRMDPKDCLYPREKEK
jgi:hypothetical protein